MPNIYYFGATAENPTGLKPFIIMDSVEHERTMSEALRDLESDESHVLAPNIGEQKLEVLYK